MLEIKPRKGKIITFDTKDKLTRNLQSLKAEFYDKGKALRVSNTLNNLIFQGRNHELVQLLRFHELPGIGDDMRFEVDELIEYYNLLMIAVFAGYIPSSFKDDLRKEIINVLDNTSIKRYYKVYYPYEMTTFTLKYAKENRQFNQEANVETISVFNEFISLNRMLRSDKDLERFIGMLYPMWHSGNSIDEVIEILSSYKKLNVTFTTKNKTKVDSAVWGFIKYTTFLSQFRELLQKAKTYPLLQSSLWMFHGYYFEWMNKEMKAFFNIAFDNLEKTLSSPETFGSIVDGLYNTEILKDFNEDDLKAFSLAKVQQARKDVNYVLKVKWGKPLKIYFSKKITNQVITPIEFDYEDITKGLENLERVTRNNIWEELKKQLDEKFKNTHLK